MRMPISELRRLRGERIDWLLSMLTGVLALLIFVFAPLQAMGITAFHLFADGLLLTIIVSMVIISNSPTALVLMSLALVFNVAVFFLRIYYPVPYHLHILAGAWLVIACTLGVVVLKAVFRRGLVTYHRIIGAILLYLLIAVAFATLFLFVGLAAPDAIKGIAFRGRSFSRRIAFLHELCHADIDWVWRHRSGRSVGTKSLQYRERDRSALSGDPSGEARYARAQQYRLSAQADPYHLNRRR